MIDVTPNSHNGNRILFIEVPVMEYYARRIDNIGIPLTNSLDVKNLIDVCEEIEGIFNTTSDIQVVMLVNLLMKKQALVQKMRMPAGRNDLCPCGSELKFKK